MFAKIKQKLDVKLGGRLETFISGGAPLSRKIGYFFERLGYQVLEGYGLTETSAGSTVNRPGRAKIGSVGEPLPGVELKIAADGEVLIRGPNVMRGYHRNPAATAEAIDAEGWLHSGDIGELDAEGRLTITDRKKDLIVTAGGKNVAPQNLENLLKSYPLVSQAMVHGDRRKYLSVLICVAEEPARAVLAAKGISVSSYAELAAHPEVQTAVQRILDAVNEDQPLVPRAEAVRARGPRVHPGDRRAHPDPQGQAQARHPEAPGGARRALRREVRLTCEGPARRAIGEAGPSGEASLRSARPAWCRPSRPSPTRPRRRARPACPRRPSCRRRRSPS